MSGNCLLYNALLSHGLLSSPEITASHHKDLAMTAGRVFSSLASCRIIHGANPLQACSLVGLPSLLAQPLTHCVTLAKTLKFSVLASAKQ